MANQLLSRGASPSTLNSYDQGIAAFRLEVGEAWQNAIIRLPLPQSAIWDKTADLDFPFKKVRADLEFLIQRHEIRQVNNGTKEEWNQIEATCNIGQKRCMDPYSPIRISGVFCKDPYSWSISATDEREERAFRRIALTAARLLGVGAKSNSPSERDRAIGAFLDTLKADAEESPDLHRYFEEHYSDGQFIGGALMDLYYLASRFAGNQADATPPDPVQPAEVKKGSEGGDGQRGGEPAEVGIEMPSGNNRGRITRLKTFSVRFIQLKEEANRSYSELIDLLPPNAELTARSLKAYAAGKSLPRKDNLEIIAQMFEKALGRPISADEHLIG